MEFVAAANWLSNTAVIHRLDQTPTPTYRDGDYFRIPGLLAIVVATSLRLNSPRFHA